MVSLYQSMSRPFICTVLILECTCSVVFFCCQLILVRKFEVAVRLCSNFCNREKMIGRKARERAMHGQTQSSEKDFY